MKLNSAKVTEAILANIDYAVAVCNGDNRAEFFNAEFESVLSVKAADLLGKKFEFIDSDKHDKDFIRQLWLELESNHEWQGELWVKVEKTYSQLSKAKIQLFKNNQDQSENYLYIFRALSSSNSEEQSQKGSLDSQHDPLTSLPNQLLFLDRSDQAIISAKREGKSVAVLLFGLDRFTIVNEGLGHDAGDFLLEKVAERLTDCIRGSDTVARIGGDNFALLLQVTAVDDSVIVAEKVLKTMLTPFDVAQQSITITASIGISLCPSDSKNTNELMRHSNSALYHAKQNGGNQYKFFASKMNDKAKTRIELENSLRRALREQEFMLFYQPKVSSESQKIVGAEALIRWQDPEKGMVSPADFIPVAEETGLIEPIGTWVLKEACRQTKRWQDDNLQRIKMSVNVSAHQFRSATFLTTLEEALTESGIDSQSIELEITESMLMNNPEQTIERLKAIRALGFHLSIDDFGTGYSSLSYLTKFPITTLKIDRAFVYDIETNKNMAEVAKAIISLSQGLELEVVAEGAESIEHVDFLKENGCDMVQGFYYSRPLPADEFEALLKIGSIYS